MIDLCAPVLTGQKGDPVRMVTYWRCRRTDSQEIRRMPSEYVQVGIPVDDWNEGQSYRSDVEDYFKNHKCSAK